MRMLISLFCLSVLSSFSFTPQVFAQTDAKNKRSKWQLTQTLAGRSAFFNHLYKEAENPGSLELSKDQVTKIGEAKDAQIKAMMRFNSVTDGDPNKSQNFKLGMGVLIDTLHKTEREVERHVLRPEQVSLLRAKVFESQLATFEGNVVELVRLRYSDVFGITRLQNEELAEVSDSLAKKLRDAKKRYQKEVNEILSEGEKGLARKMSTHQKSLLKAYGGNLD